MPLRQALERAEEQGLDLVEVDATASPPVCKILDHGKHRYEDKKRSRASKKKQFVVQIKEVKFRPGTDEGDYKVKLRNIRRFLEQGHKAKVTLRFRGREMTHPELGVRLLQRIEQDMAEIGVVENAIKRENRLMTVVLAPKRRPAKPRDTSKDVRESQEPRTQEAEKTATPEASGETAGKAVGEAAGQAAGQAVGEAVGQAVGEAVGEAAGQAVGEASEKAAGEAAKEPAQNAGSESSEQL